MLPGAGYCPRRGIQHVLARHQKFVLEVDVRRRNKDVDAGVCRLLDRAQRLVDILLTRTREAEYSRTGQRLGNPAHRLEIAWRLSGEAGLDYVDVEPFELARDCEF